MSINKRGGVHYNQHPVTLPNDVSTMNTDVGAGVRHSITDQDSVKQPKPDLLPRPSARHMPMSTPSTQVQQELAALSPNAVPAGKEDRNHPALGTSSLLSSPRSIQTFMDVLHDYASGMPMSQLRNRHHAFHQILSNHGGLVDSTQSKMFMQSLQPEQQAHISEAIAARKQSISYLRIAPHLVQIAKALSNPANALSAIATKLGLDPQDLHSVLESNELTPRGRAFIAEQPSAVRNLFNEALRSRKAAQKTSITAENIVSLAPPSALVGHKAVSTNVTSLSSLQPKQVEHVPLPAAIAQIKVPNIRLAILSFICSEACGEHGNAARSTAAQKSGIAENLLNQLVQNDKNNTVSLTELGEAYMQQCCTHWERGTLHALLRAAKTPQGSAF